MIVHLVREAFADAGEFKRQNKCNIYVDVVRKTVWFNGAEILKSPAVLFAIHVFSVIQDYPGTHNWWRCIFSCCVFVGSSPCERLNFICGERCEQKRPTEPRARVKSTALVSAPSPCVGPEWHRRCPSQQRDTALSIPPATETQTCAFFFTLGLMCPCDRFKGVNRALDPVQILKRETGAERALKAHLQVWCSGTKRSVWTDPVRPSSRPQMGTRRKIHARVIRAGILCWDSCEGRRGWKWARLRRGHCDMTWKALLGKAAHRKP